MIASVQPSMDASSNSSARRRCCLGASIGARPPSPIKPWIGGFDGFCSIIETTAAVVVALTGGTLVADLALLLPIGFAGSFAWCVRRRPERQPLQPIGQQPKLRVRAFCGKVIDDRLNRVAVAQRRGEFIRV